MVTAAKRRYVVARSPATVDDTGGFIVTRPNIPAVIVSATRDEAAAGQQDRQRQDHEDARL